MPGKMTKEQVIALHDEIAAHLDAIGKLFNRPRVTLVVRDPDLPDGELVLTQDTRAAIVTAVLKQMAKKPISVREVAVIDVRQVI